MICKKCGAYNPDHATFCKVCAANLKDQTNTEEAVEVNEAEEAVEKEFRPRRGNVVAPDYASARRSNSFKAAEKAKEPDEDEVEDEELEEEEAKPAQKKSIFAPPARKRRAVEEEDLDEDDLDIRMLDLDLDAE